MLGVMIWGYWKCAEGRGVSTLHVSEVPSRAYETSSGSKRRKVLLEASSDSDGDSVSGEEVKEQKKEEPWPAIHKDIRVIADGVFCCSLYEQQLEVLPKIPKKQGPLLLGQYGTRLNATEWANLYRQAEERLGPQAPEPPDLQDAGLPETQEARMELARALLAQEDGYSTHQLLLLVLPQEFFTLCRYGDATKVVPFLTHSLEVMIRRQDDRRAGGSRALRQIVDLIAEMALALRQQPLTFLCASPPHPLMHVLRASGRGLAELGTRLKSRNMSVLADERVLRIVRELNVALASPRLWVWWEISTTPSHMNLLRYLVESECSVAYARHWVRDDRLDAWARTHGRGGGLGAAMVEAVSDVRACREPVLHSFMSTVISVGKGLSEHRLSLFVPSARDGEEELVWCVKNTRIVCCPLSSFAASQHRIFMNGLRRFDTLTMLAPCETSAAQLRELYPKASVHVTQQVNFLKRDERRKRTPRVGRDRAHFLEVLSEPVGVDRAEAARHGGVWSGSAGRETNLVVPVARDAREGSEWLVVPRQSVLVVWHADLMGLHWWDYFLSGLLWSSSITVVLVGTPVQAPGPLCTDVQGPFSDLCLLAAHKQQLAAEGGKKQGSGARACEIDPLSPMPAEDMRVACVALAAGLEETKDLPMRPLKRLQRVIAAGQSQGGTRVRTARARQPRASSVLEDEEQTMYGYEDGSSAWGSQAEDMMDGLSQSLDESPSVMSMPGSFFSLASGSASASESNRAPGSARSARAGGGRSHVNVGLLPPAVVLAAGGAHVLNEGHGHGNVTVQVGHVRVRAVRQLVDAAGVLHNDILRPARQALSVQAVTSTFDAAKDLDSKWREANERWSEGGQGAQPSFYLTESMDCLRMATEDAGTEECIRRKVREGRSHYRSLLSMRRHAPYPTLQMETGHWLLDQEGDAISHVTPVAMPARPEDIRQQCVVPARDFVGTRDVIVVLCQKGTKDKGARDLLLRALGMAQLHVVIMCDNPGLVSDPSCVSGGVPRFPYLPSMLGIMDVPEEEEEKEEEEKEEGAEVVRVQARDRAGTRVEEELMEVDAVAGEGPSSARAPRSRRFRGYGSL